MLVLGVILAMAVKVNVQISSAAVKEDLKDKLRKQISDNILYEYYDDYNGDGVNELFAVTGEKDNINQIWFVNDTYTECVYNNGKSVYYGNVFKVSDKQKLIVFETGAGGSGSWSVCYYLSEGKAVRVQKCGEGLSHISGKKFIVCPGEFDAMRDESGMIGHTWKAYYLKWTGHDFKEYIGKQISIGKLKKYKNANKYLKQIKKMGYKTSSIYKRSNGIINVNIYLKEKQSILYDNITLKVKGKKVTLLVNNKKGKNIVEKSSYGGIYKAQGFL